MKLHLKRKYNILDRLIVIYLFLGVFLPPCPLLPTNDIVVILSVVICFVGLIKIKTIALNSRLIYGLLCFLPFYLYFVIIQAYHIASDNGNRTVYTYLFRPTLYPLLYGSLFCLSITIIVTLRKYTLQKVLYLFILVGILQLIFVLLTYYFQPLRDLVFELNVKYSPSEILSKAYERLARDRGYGLSNNLFDSFGYLTSFLISFTFIKGLSEQLNKYIILSLAMMIMPLLNARTGVVLSILGISIISLFFFRVNKIMKYIFVAILIVLVAIIALPRLSMWDWIQAGFYETQRLIMEHDLSSGVYSEILKADIVIPDHIWIGVGGSPEQLGRYSGIDSGYIQCLWRYGIIGSVLLFSGYIGMFLVACHNRDKLVCCLGTIFVSFYFVYLLKLYSISNFGATFIMFGIFAAIISCTSDTKELFY